MSYSAITQVGITRGTLDALVNNLKFTKNCYRGFEDNHFGNADPVQGSILYVRLPREYKTYTGWNYQPGDVTDQTIPISITTPRAVSLDFIDEDLSLNIDKFNELFMNPAGIQMANDIDFEGIGEYVNVWNQVGTPNDTPDSIDVFTDAGTVLKNNSVPMDGSWTALIDPVTAGSILKGTKTLFNPAADLSRQYREGILGMSSGFTLMETQNIHNHLPGNFGTSCVVKTPPTEGGNTIVIDTFAGVVGTPGANVGDIFTIEGVNMVNFKNKQDTGMLQQFVVTSAVWDGGNSDLTITFKPVIYASTTNPFQNVTSLGIAGADVVFAGTQNVPYKVNLAFHKNAFCFVSARLHIPGGCDMAYAETIEDTTLRLTRKWSIDTSTYKTKMDIFYGFATPRGQLACRIAC